jgi:hypothetical protein
MIVFESRVNCGAKRILSLHFIQLNNNNNNNNNNRIVFLMAANMMNRRRALKQDFLDLWFGLSIQGIKTVPIYPEY